MRTFLHAIIIAATFAVAAPTQSIASTSIAEMTMSSDECKARIVVNQATVTIEGLAGKTLEVVSLTGRLVMKTKIESNSQQVFQLPQFQACCVCNCKDTNLKAIHNTKPWRQSNS